jgi:hypothetical protein
MGGVSSSKPTYQQRLESFGIRRTYWLIPSAFGLMATGSFVAVCYEPESRLVLLACGALFCSISLLGFLWPLLRVREVAEARFANFRFKQDDMCGAFFPISRVKRNLFLIGGSIFGIAGLAALVFADNTEYRIKGGIAFVFYLGFVAVSLYGNFRGEQGLLVSEQGLLFRDSIHTCFVPWDYVGEVRIYTHNEKHTSSTSLGFRFHDIEALELKSRTRATMMESEKRYGWHLYYQADSLVPALEMVQDCVNLYLHDQKARGELATGVAVNRMAEFCQ